MEPNRKPSARPILIGLAALIVGLYAIPKIGAWLILRRMTDVEASMPLPKEMRKGRVLIGEEKLSKGTFARAKTLGQVTDMRMIGGELIVAGTRGALRADAQGRVNGEALRYPRGYMSDVRIVPLKGGSTYDLFNVGTILPGPALFDRDGAVLWESSQPVDSAAVGDMDGDGVLSIALGYAGGGGVELRDLKNRTRWKGKAANPWHLEIPERAPGERPYLLYSNAGGNVVARDASGKATTMISPSYVSHFVPLRWPDASGKTALLAGAVKDLLVIGLKGKLLASFSAPAPAPDIEPAVVSACRVALKEGREYLAVSVEPSPYNERAMLYVYAPDGTLVYQELLAQQAGPLLAVPRADRPGAQTLLVGGENEIFSYGL